MCGVQWLVDKLADGEPDAGIGRSIVATTANAVQGTLTVPFPLLAFYIIHGSDNFISHDFTPYPHFLYSKRRLAQSVADSAAAGRAGAAATMAAHAPAAALLDRIETAAQQHAGTSEVEVMHEEVTDANGGRNYVSALDDYVYRDLRLSFLPPFFFHMWFVKERQDKIFMEQQSDTYHGTGAPRFVLQSPHPQAATHMLRMRTAPVIPMWLHGLPNEVPSESSTATERDGYAAFVLGSFASDRVWRVEPGEPGTLWAMYQAWLKDTSCPFRPCTQQVLHNLEAYFSTRRAHRQRGEVRVAALRAAQELAQQLDAAGTVAAPHPMAGADDDDDDDDMQVCFKPGHINWLRPATASGLPQPPCVLACSHATCTPA